MHKIIIGLSGEMGSGKGTVAHYLSDKYRFSKFRMSDMLRDILERLHLEESRENMSKTSSMIRDTFGQDIMSKNIVLDAQAGEKDVVVDGIRREEDIVHLRKLKNFFLVYIEVDERLRYNRLVARAENAGDATKTFEEFQKEQQLDADSRITSLKKNAYCMINNDGDMAKLYRRVEEVVRAIKGV